MQNIRICKVGLTQSLQMPSMLWSVSSDLQTWHYFASVVSSLSQTRPSQDLVTWARDWRGGRREDEGTRSGDTEACLGPVWPVGSLSVRPGLNISRSGPPDLCQQAEETTYSRLQSGVSRPQTDCSLLKMGFCDIYYYSCFKV